ncbi:MAG: COX15/CtaA family protein, partial [Bacteroidia bacterium]|nr:COX15/CtaA family protein [Bacteroidia bacterium]
GKSFKKGHMVIHHEALWKARRDFTAGADFSEADWEKYTKHDYAVFNPAHTWTEFLNRLVGALTGLIILGLFLTSLPYRKYRLSVTVFSFLSLILVMIEGWLGKLVVDSNLREGMITIHMVGAMLTLVALITARVFAFPVSSEKKTENSFTRLIFMGAGISFLILLQIAIGTQVRENVDVVAKSLGDAQRSQWIENLGAVYRYHTSFYIFLMIAIVFWVFQLKDFFGKIPGVKGLTIATVIILLSEILAGMMMNAFDIPPVLQPVHLLLATLLFGCSYWIMMLFVTARK